MKCPSCNEILILTERKGVEVEYCRKCKGVWLDRGELDKIIERSANYHSGLDHNRHEDHKQDPSQSGNHYKRKKRKGFLDDLFDFD